MSESLEQQVNNPSHYGGQDNVYEAIKVIEAWQVDFCLGNTLKYISRAGQKPGESEIKDLKKAEWYLRRRIEQLERRARSERIWDSLRVDPGQIVLNNAK